MTTNSPSTDATPRPWSYEIQYGPNGEEIYAWVYYRNLMVCTAKVHHAMMIVEAANAYKPLYTRPAPSQSVEPAASRLGRWLAAALDDPNVCAEMKADINAWFEAGEPASQSSEAAKMREALMDATANLVAAASAYQKYAARHRSVGRATADPMFTTRVADFEKAAKRAQSAIRALPLPSDDGEVRS